MHLLVSSHFYIGFKVIVRTRKMEYIERFQIVQAKPNMETIQPLEHIMFGILQRIEFQPAIGEAELFLNNISLGRTTAGKLVFPSPESKEYFSSTTAPTEKVLRSKGFPCGFSTYYLENPVFSVKIYTKDTFSVNSCQILFVFGGVIEHVRNGGQTFCVPMW